MAFNTQLNAVSQDYQPPGKTNRVTNITEPDQRHGKLCLYFPDDDNKFNNIYTTPPIFSPFKDIKTQTASSSSLASKKKLSVFKNAASSFLPSSRKNDGGKPSNFIESYNIPINERAPQVILVSKIQFSLSLYYMCKGSSTCPCPRVSCAVALGPAPPPSSGSCGARLPPCPLSSLAPRPSVGTASPRQRDPHPSLHHALTSSRTPSDPTPVKTKSDLRPSQIAHVNTHGSGRSLGRKPPAPNPYFPAPSPPPPSLAPRPPKPQTWAVVPPLTAPGYAKPRPVYTPPSPPNLIFPLISTSHFHLSLLTSTFQHASPHLHLIPTSCLSPPYSWKQSKVEAMIVAPLPIEPKREIDFFPRVFRRLVMCHHHLGFGAEGNLENVL
ncbi:extensin-like [Penaeus chinensis]|uniref:extensin-like n=1 Tax=Penaeus chinensis TaxID=139456 RepID=UPI001FB5B3B9|nr:extensin-like [Penaeus chinensis]